MEPVFRIVASALSLVSRITGFTYNEINIMVYYLLIPMTWAALLDKAFRFHWIKIGFASAALIVALAGVLICGFSRFCDRLFDASVALLNSLQIVHLNYM